MYENREQFDLQSTFEEELQKNNFLKVDTEERESYNLKEKYQFIAIVALDTKFSFLSDLYLHYHKDIIKNLKEDSQLEHTKYQILIFCGACLPLKMIKALANDPSSGDDELQEEQK